MQSSTNFKLVTALLFASLLFSLFVLPTRNAYDETCPRCHGRATVDCEGCWSGACITCDGTGRIWFMDDSWCGICQGTGNCPTCEGIGWFTCGKCGGTGLHVHWIYNLIGATVVPSFIGALLFLGLFIFNGWVSAFYLSFNEWVYEVKNMDFWFNPSFMTWLFAKHRKRWAKWTTGISSILSIYLGALLFGLLSFKQIILETFVIGTLLTIPVVISFSVFFYKSYISRLSESQ